MTVPDDESDDSSDWGEWRGQAKQRPDRILPKVVAPAQHVTVPDDESDDSSDWGEWRGQNNDARHSLPHITAAEREAFGPVATSAEVIGKPSMENDEFWQFIQRPGGFHAIVDAGQSPFNLWKKLP